VAELSDLYIPIGLTVHLDPGPWQPDGRVNNQHVGDLSAHAIETAIHCELGQSGIKYKSWIPTTASGLAQGRNRPVDKFGVQVINTRQLALWVRFNGVLTTSESWVHCQQVAQPVNL